MRILLKAAAVGLLLMWTSIGFAAHSITNGDAETGDMTGWTPSNAGAPNPDAVESAVLVLAPDATGDTYFFSTGEATVGDGGSASMSQDVYVWGCGVEYLEGTMKVMGLQEADGDGDTDTAHIKVEFFDMGDNSLGSYTLSPANNGYNNPWGTFDTGANGVFTNAFSMTLTLRGTDQVSVGDEYADVGFDNVVLTSDGCLDNFAKISGKIQGSGGNPGQWSFAGSVGTDEDSDDVVGEIAVNYKLLNEQCVFTPDDDGLSFSGTEDVAIVVGNDDGGFECFDGDGPTSSGDFVMRLRSGDATTNNSGGSGKDRGGICIAATGTAYDIGVADCDANGDIIPLKNGNAWVDDDTSDDAP